MKLGTFILVIILGTMCFSCNSGGKKDAATEAKNPYADVTLVTEWGQGPGIEAYADYQYTMGSVFGEYTIHGYSNQEKGDVAFITDDNRKVITLLEIPNSELKQGQYINYFGAIENFDPKREYWINPYEINPYYIVIYQVKSDDDFIGEAYFDTVVKAWRFNKETKQFEIVSSEGLGVQNESYGVD